MAYYRALQQLERPPQEPARRAAWALDQTLWTILFNLLPFLVVLAPVATLHFSPHWRQAPDFGLMFRLSWRPDSLGAVLLLVFAVAPFPALFGVLGVQSYQNARPVRATFASFADEVRYKRSLRFLAEEGRPLFFRRLGFAVAIALSADGLVAQLFGFRTGAFGDGLILPAVIAGAAGFYVYALVGFLQRFRTANLSQRMLPSLYVRLAVVVILAGVAEVLTGKEGQPLTMSAAFIAGIFPDFALLAAAKVAGQSNFGNRFAVDPPSDFQRLPELDLWGQTALAEIGVNNIHDLANSPVEDVLLDIGVIPPVLLQAMDRALLLDAFAGPTTQPAAGTAAAAEPADVLKKLGVTSASGLVLYMLGQDVTPPDDPPPGRRLLLGPTLDAPARENRRRQVMQALGRLPAAAAPPAGNPAPAPVSPAPATRPGVHVNLDAAQSLMAPPPPPVAAADAIAPAAAPTPTPDEPMELQALRFNVNVLYILNKRFLYADA